MSRVKKVWHLLPHDGEAIRRLAGELQISPVIAQLLLNRGITQPDFARRFLDSSLAALHPPERLPGIPQAVERITAAIAAGRSICVYGDYDTDGLTGTAILVRLIQFLGGKATFYIPNRLEEGYGLNTEAIHQLKTDGIEMIVTVDCGITAVAEAAEARKLGIELIVTDHHEFADELPAAAAVVHPRLPGTQYPFGDLSGSGVAFKLAWALAQRASNGDRVTPPLREFLLGAIGIAALGLVADVVPLRDENRILVRRGLEQLSERPPLGIKALMVAAEIAGKAIRSEDVGFKLAPRLNAAGRLGCARLVVELLTTSSQDRAKELAECLDGFNQQRQTIERRITQQARDLVAADGHESDPVLVLGSEDWHAGVVGIVAGRLAELFARPVVLVALKPGDEVSTGSGRSVTGFELHEALRACADDLVGFGGHAAAAGVRIRPSRLPSFRERLKAYAVKRLPPGPPAPRLMLDAEVPLSSLTYGLLRDLDKLEPYGADNQRPRFLAAGLQVEGTPRRMGKPDRHLGFSVKQGRTTMRAIAFGMADRLDELMSANGQCCLAFTPRVNTYQNRNTIELEIVDLVAGSYPELR